MSRLILMHVGSGAAGSVISQLGLSTLGVVVGVIIFAVGSLFFIGVSLSVTMGKLAEFIIFGLCSVAGSAGAGLLVALLVSLVPWVVLGILVLVAALCLIALVYHAVVTPTGVGRGSY